ncbi:ankyrin-2 protein [Spatholobus suberectus]|nr:ankyrin-2 protein [Spatholobus suberectus]
METITAANPVEASDLGESVSAVSSRPLSPSLHDTGGSNNNITRIDRKLYLAAVEGNFREFTDTQNLESQLTPNKNTVLHIHLTSTRSETTQNVSQTFVQQIKGKCRGIIFQTRETGTPVSQQFVDEILDKCSGLVLLPNAKGENTPSYRCKVWTLQYREVIG